MSIFNSLGSNYNAAFALRALFAYPNQSAVTKLTSGLAKFYGGEVILAYKCRQSLRLALAFSGLPSGSAVAINGFTCYAVYQAVTDAGYHPVYLDPASGELNFSGQELTNSINKYPNLRAVIVQNTLGQLCDIASISSICKSRNLILIEDLAHSIGGQYATGQSVGTVGDFTVLSFSQDKVVDGVSGGALVVRDTAHLPKLRVAPTRLPVSRTIKDRLYPLITTFIRATHSIYLGRIVHRLVKTLNLLPRPMDSVGGTNLTELPAWYAEVIWSRYENLSKTTDHREAIAHIYEEGLSGNPHLSLVSRVNGKGAWLRFPVLVKDRDKLISYLKQNGIYISDTWYDAPIAPIKYLGETTYKNGDCPNSEILSREIINLPTHINVSVEDTRRIVGLINTWSADVLRS